MRRVFGIAFVILVAVVFINDGGRWVNAQSALNENTTRLAQWASTTVRGSSVGDNDRVVTIEGARLGVRVDRYEQDANELRIWTSTDVQGTWVIGPYVAVLKGTPLDQALGVPFVVRSSQVASHQ